MNFSKEKAQAYLKKKDEQNNSSAVNSDNVSYAVNSDNVSFNAEKARAYLSDNEGKPVRQYTVRFDASDTGASDSGYSPSMKASYDSFLAGREKSKPMPETLPRCFLCQPHRAAFLCFPFDGMSILQIPKMRHHQKTPGDKVLITGH